MQYLSKAYNFYSGINPATLSGAIDVIVVKHVEEDGQVTLSSSPFHVRFGKLQVLRAAEKRVTLRMPNNLPPPHVAPFSMKVGESGEAFFVLETDEEVPEDLLTSPVVSPTDANELPPTPPLSSNSQESHVSLSSGRTMVDGGPPSGHTTEEEPGNHPSLTQQPFGQTEQQVSHDHMADTHDLADVEPLDLDRPASPESTSTMTPVKAAPIDKTSAAASPSSILNTASSLLPSFLSSNPGSKSGTLRDTSPEVEESKPGEKQAGKEGKPIVSQTQPPENPENPVAAGPGESTEDLPRNETLSTYKKTREAEHLVDPSKKPDELPKVEPGQGEGPDVVYGKDIVLDVSGYHSAGKATEEHHSRAEHAMEEEAFKVDSALKAAKVMKEHVESPTKVRQALVDAFTQDLLASIPSHSYGSASKSWPPLPGARSTDPSFSPSRSKAQEDIPRLSEPDLSSTLESLSLETEDATPSKREAARRRADRGQSEPPPDLDEEDYTPTLPSPPSPLVRPPNGSIYPYPAQPPPRPVTPVNLPNTWDWARVPPHSPESGGVEDVRKSVEMERSASGPSERPKEERARSDSLPASGMDLATPKLKPTKDPSSSAMGRLKDSEENPHLFVLEMDGGKLYTFELALCEVEGFALQGEASDGEEAEFIKNRITFAKFIEDPHLVEDSHLVVRYSLQYLTWTTGYNLLSALSMYRRSLTPAGLTPPGMANNARTTGSGWSKWWRRAQGASISTDPMRQIPAPAQPVKVPDVPVVVKTSPDSPQSLPIPPKDRQYAKTLRLSSDQLKSLNLKPGPNTVHFSVTSSYSGLATCTARIFLWDDADQIVISDIDGTITKSDALGHVFAAIGRDWTHLGIAKLYTDIANNGYKILYLTSRAIGQADSTREYLKSIVQSEYRLPEGPVIMSPDRLMASLHREVIMRKPELFKMACLRDIQRLFGQKARESFFAGFGNRITDAMSYRSVGIDTSKIYTIDSTGVVKTELLQAAGHRGSYVGLNDLVNETFPPVGTKFKPEFTDFNWWRSTIPEVSLPDLTPVPVSPALSARSASSTTSSRYNVLGRISQTIGRKSSKQPLLPTTNDDTKSVASANSRPSSPLIGPSLSSEDLSDDEEYGHRHSSRRNQGSMPGSFESQSGEHFPEFMAQQRAEEGRSSPLSGSPHNSDQESEDEGERRQDSFDDGAIFDDDILATGEMKNVPF